MMNEKENWRENVLNSLEGIKPAEPRKDLFDDIWSAVSTPKIKTKIIPLSIVRLAAACLLLLVCFNGILVVRQLQSDATDTTESVENTYTNLITNFSYYE